MAHDKPRGSTLSNHEVSEALSGLKKLEKGQRRRNSSLTHSPAVNHASPLAAGLLPPRKKRETALKEAVRSGSPKKTKGSKIKEFFTAKRSSTPNALRPKKSSNRTSFKSNSIKPKYKLDIYDKEKIIQLQSFWRMVMARKVRSGFRTAESLEKVRGNMRLLLNNENTYLLELQTLKEKYFAPRPSLPKGKDKRPATPFPEDISILFPNIDRYLEYHSSFMKSLRECISQWPLRDFSLLLLSHSYTLTELYENLPSQMRESQQLLSELLKNQNFCDFLSKTKHEHPNGLENRTLKSLLTSPLSYLFKFEEPCKVMIEPLWNSSAFFSRMLTVSAVSTQLAIFLQEKTDLAGCHKVTSLLESSSGMKEPLPAPVGSYRRFIRDRLVKVNSKKHKIYLFSDVLVLVQVKLNQLKFSAVYLLANLSVSKMRKITKKETPVYSYHILVNGEEKLTLKCRENATHGLSYSLIGILQEAIGTSQDQVFGKPLDIVMPDPNTLPIIFRKVVYHLDRAEDHTHLFRRSANPTAVNQLRVNESHFESSDISSAHRDDIAGLLLLYLEELPDHIIEFDVIMNIPDLQKTNLAPYIEFYHQRKFMKHLQIAIAQISERRQHFLEYLSYFLARLIDTGKLTSWELAYHFTPFIISCGKKRKIEYARAMPKLMQIVELLISRRDKLFHPAEKVSLPTSMKEFFDSDKFGPWWKLFRESNKKFLRFIVSPASVRELVSFLIVPQDCAEMATNLLTTNKISHLLIENPLLLDEFFSVLRESIPEDGMKWIVSVLIKFFSMEPVKMASYLLYQNAAFNDLIVAHISSGSISSFLDEVVKRSHIITELHELLAAWCMLAFDQILLSNYSLENDRLCNSVNFLASVLQEESFLPSKAFVTFRNHLSPAKIKELIRLAVNTSDPCTSCAMQRVVGALIVLKELNQSMPNTSSVRIDADSLKFVRNMIMLKDADWQEDWGGEAEEEGAADSDDEESDDEDPDVIDMKQRLENLDIASESSFNTKGGEVEEKQRRFSKSSSFTPFLWSATRKSSKGTDIHTTTLLKMFLAQHEVISTALLNPELQSFGHFRLGLIHLIQSTIFACDDSIIQKIIKTKLLNACVCCMFNFPNNNIMHHAVQDTITGILAQNDDSMVYHLLLDTPLVAKTLEILQNEEIKFAPLHGHLSLIINSLHDNVSFNSWIKQSKTLSPLWTKFCPKIEKSL